MIKVLTIISEEHQIDLSNLYLESKFMTETGNSLIPSV